MVDFDGKNRYMHDDIWLSDGYGDYVRHYLRSMASKPELAPADQNHLLSSTSVIQFIKYATNINNAVEIERQVEMAKNTIVHYRTFDKNTTETLRQKTKPSAVFVDKNKIPESSMDEKESWRWKAMEIGGLLTIRHQNGNLIAVMGN